MRTCHSRFTEFPPRILELIHERSYLDNLERISRGDYEPSLEDFLRSRLTTTGIAETLFEERSRNSKFHVFDVGGARSERRKWVHVFEGVQCLVFLAPINGYNRCLIEDKESVGWSSDDDSQTCQN